MTTPAPKDGLGKRRRLAPATLRRVAREDGTTITEMLVVLVILLVVLGGMSTLFVSASTSQADQSNRHRAQQDARLALDALRREIRCATSATAAPSSLTITLPGACQKPATATAASFTWCAVGASAPYALWRYSGASCSGSGRRITPSLASNAVFSYNRGSVVPAPLLTTSTCDPGCSIKAGTYAYAVTAVNASGAETSGTVSSVTIPTGDKNNVTVSWSPFAGAASYNVYGRDDGSRTTEGLRLLQAGITSPLSFTDTGSVVVSGETQSPPLAVVSVNLTVDVSQADGRHRFKLADDIVLRNSGRT